MRFQDRLDRFLTNRRLPIALAALAVMLASPSLWIGRQSDDFYHQVTFQGSSFFPATPSEQFSFVNGDPDRNHILMDLGLFPWWTWPELKLAFCRPLSTLTHWLDHLLWPDHPAVMHVHNLLWFGALIAAATVLFRRIMGVTWAAGLAALLYAVDDAHGLPVAWIANRNALLAVFFGVLALIAHDRLRRDGWRPGIVVGPAALLLGLLSGELAVGAGGYLLAYALFVDRAPMRTRLLALAPYAAVAIGWAVAYRRLGYGASGSEFYVDPIGDPWRFLLAVVDRVPILLLGQWSPLPSETSLVVSVPTRGLLWIAATLFVVLVVGVVGTLLRRNRIARFWMLGMVLAVLPGCATLPMDRLLFFVGLGAMGLVGLFLQSIRENATKQGPRSAKRLVCSGLAALLVVVHGVVAPLELPCRTLSLMAFSGLLDALVDALPEDGEIEHKDVVIVNAPSAMVAGLYVPAIRAVRNRTVPAHTRALASGLVAIDIHRPDARTLVIRPEGGFLLPPGTRTGNDAAHQPHISLSYALQHFDRLMRDDAHPMHVGQQVELTGLRVEVTEVGPAGKPTEASFRFSVPLEDPSLVWLQYKAGRYEPFIPPEINQRVRLPAAELRFGLTGFKR